MKVLFAVSNEAISEAIIERYQKMYKENLVYKDVYYFNAVIKELEKNEYYDAIVMDEALESIRGDRGDSILINSLESIVEYAYNVNPNMSIVLILKQQRQKGEDFLSKLYNLGLYNALIGQDRKISTVCEVIAKPRTEKEAIESYGIVKKETDKKIEQTIVPIDEIRSIKKYYRNLSDDEQQYSDTFNKIAKQYTDYELAYIISKLPIQVTDILSKNNEKYKSISKNAQKLLKNKQKEKVQNVNEFLSDSDIVIPKEKKAKSIQSNEGNIINISGNKDLKEEKIKENQSKSNTTDVVNNSKEDKSSFDINNIKTSSKQTMHSEDIDFGDDDFEKSNEKSKNNTNNKDNIKPSAKQTIYSEDIDFGDDDFEKSNNKKNEKIIPNLRTKEEKTNEIRKGFESNNLNPINENTTKVTPTKNNYISKANTANFNNSKSSIFVGTSKNGVSFMVNSLAMFFASIGINVAILDLTKNKNSYYMSTNNDEKLRQIATESINKLKQGIANGIEVLRNLTVYTALPTDQTKPVEVNEILTTLYKNHSLVLIDADYDTPMEYFKFANDIYIVQSLDILTIQPATLFMRDLKKAGCLPERKLKIIINKEMPIKGLTKKAIVGALSTYNSPSMTSIEKLFDRNKVRVFSVKFDLPTFQKYMENIVYCKYEVSGYSKTIVEDMKIIAGDIYPLNNRW